MQAVVITDMDLVWRLGALLSVDVLLLVVLMCVDTISIRSVWQRQCVSEHWDLFVYILCASKVLFLVAGPSANCVASLSSFSN